MTKSMGQLASPSASIDWTPRTSTTLSLLKSTGNISDSKSRLETARMSITVYVGHSGQRLTLDPSVTNTIEALKAWLQAQIGVQPRSQILLTSQGRQVRSQTLLTEHEIFVFDSNRLNAKAPSDTPSPGDGFDPGVAPDTLSNQNDLQAWQILFRLRKNWATELLQGCEVRAKEAQRYQDEQAVIERC